MFWFHYCLYSCISLVFSYRHVLTDPLFFKKRAFKNGREQIMKICFRFISIRIHVPLDVYYRWLSIDPVISFYIHKKGLLNVAGEQIIMKKKSLFSFITVGIHVFLQFYYRYVSIVTHFFLKSTKRAFKNGLGTDNEKYICLFSLFVSMCQSMFIKDRFQQTQFYSIFKSKKGLKMVGEQMVKQYIINIYSCANRCFIQMYQNSLFLFLDPQKGLSKMAGKVKHVYIVSLLFVSMYLFSFL